MEVEICIDSVEGAIVASKYNAKRVELCSALSEGGLTPSIGMMEAVCKASTAEVHVMIRPSAGGFIYSQDELLIMEQDIRAAKAAGAHGVVFGVLTNDNVIAIKENLFLMETCIELELTATFHRAVDLCISPVKALKDLINLGFKRVLTSGAARTAFSGLSTIEAMVKAANGKIEVMAGSGISAENVSEFKRINIDAIHFTAKQELNQDLALAMGPKYAVDEEKIKAILDVLN